MAGRAGQSDQWARESAADPLECSARDCKGACVCVFLRPHDSFKSVSKPLVDCCHGLHCMSIVEVLGAMPARRPLKNELKQPKTHVVNEQPLSDP